MKWKAKTKVPGTHSRSISNGKSLGEEKSENKIEKILRKNKKNIVYKCNILSF